MELDGALREQSLTCNVGITLGETFCGLVGAPGLRCEYYVMGPSVNLAARLMVASQKKGLPLLCDDAIHAELQAHSDKRFAFESLEAIKVKGYSKPVVIFHPTQDERWIQVGPLTYWLLLHQT